MSADLKLYLIRVLTALGAQLGFAVDVVRDATVVDGIVRLPNLDVLLTQGEHAGRTGVLTHMALNGCRICLDVDERFVQPVVVRAEDSEGLVIVGRSAPVPLQGELN